MSRRILFIVFAVLISGATIFLVHMWMSGESSPRSPRAIGTNASPPVVRVLVVNAETPEGGVLKGDQLRWQSWPADSAASYVVEGQARASDFVGGVLRSRLAAGEPVIAGEVAHPGERGMMAAVLTPGYSAVTVNVTPSTGMAGFIFPGDRVDVLLTTTVPAAANGTPRHMSQTLLTNIRVVGVDQTLSDEKKPAAKDVVAPKTVTLEVTRKQAEVVTVAAELGILSLSLRSLASGADGLSPAAGPPTWDSDLTHVAASIPIIGRPAPIRVVQIRSEHGVTVFRGTEATTAAAPSAPVPGVVHP